MNRPGTNQYTIIELIEVPEATDVAIVPPGSVAKIEVMRARFARGEAIFHEQDSDYAYYQQHGGDVDAALYFTVNHGDITRKRTYGTHKPRG